MKKLLRLKHKAPGLTVIAAIGLLQSLLPLYGSLNYPSKFVYAFENKTNAWAVLRLPFLFLVLWLVCFGLVKVVQNKTLDLEFFEKFTAWKGLAVLLLWPSVLFWWQLFNDYHEALDFLHPFHSLVVTHVVLGFLFVIIFVPMMLYLANRQKTTKTDIKILESLKQNGVQAFLWIRPFFQDVGSDRFGKIVGGFVGVSYLIFFYTTLISLITPAVLAVQTIGSTVEAHDVNYIWASKFGTQTGHYCVLDVNANSERLEFVINRCPACARRPGANVLVTHHPMDYRNRRISSVLCE
jgi:hypothetical protein